MELITTWKEEGIQEGIQIGRQEGEQTGKQAEALSITRRLLIRRFGALTSEQEERIASLSLPKLETLIEDLLDFTRIEDVQHWLDTNLPDEPEANTTD
jgi:flagellar biosynthesis/type III secretory pathway protein FliH